MTLDAVSVYIDESIDVDVQSPSFDPRKHIGQRALCPDGDSVGRPDAEGSRPSTMTSRSGRFIFLAYAFATPFALGAITGTCWPSCTD